MKLLFRTFPPTTNHMYGRSREGHTFLTKDAREAKEAIGWEARVQYQGQPLTGPLIVQVALFRPTRARMDSDNLKPLYDALNGIVWADDSQIQQLIISKAVDRDDPRIEMMITPLPASSRARAA